MFGFDSTWALGKMAEAASGSAGGQDLENTYIDHCPVCQVTLLELTIVLDWGLCQVWQLGPIDTRAAHTEELRPIWKNHIPGTFKGVRWDFVCFEKLEVYFPISFSAFKLVMTITFVGCFFFTKKGIFYFCIGGCRAVWNPHWWQSLGTFHNLPSLTMVERSSLPMKMTKNHNVPFVAGLKRTPLGEKHCYNMKQLHKYLSA